MRRIKQIARTIPPGLRLMVATAGAILVAAGCARIASLAEAKPPPELKEGKIFLNSGNESEAIAKFEAAIASRPKDPRVFSEIMYIAAHANQKALVDRYYGQGVESSRSLSKDEQAAIHIGAGYAYLFLRDFDRAIQANRQALDLSPDNVYALNGLGYSYVEAERKEELDDAIRMITRAITLARERNANAGLIGAIVDSLGWAYFKQGNYDDALKTLAEAASLAPHLGEIQYHLGLAYERKGRLEDARVALARAKTLDPEMAMFDHALQRVTAELKARKALKDKTKGGSGPAADRIRPN